MALWRRAATSTRFAPSVTRPTSRRLRRREPVESAEELRRHRLPEPPRVRPSKNKLAKAPVTAWRSTIAVIESGVSSVFCLVLEFANRKHAGQHRRNGLY